MSPCIVLGAFKSACNDGKRQHLINAVTGEVEPAEIHMSGNATYQELSVCQAASRVWNPTHRIYVKPSKDYAARVLVVARLGAQ